MKKQILTLLVSTAISAMSPVFAMDIGDETKHSKHHLSPNAQYKLGCAYLYGDGVPLDFSEAVKHLKIAADQGHADAQDKLGSAYWCGYGVAQDRGEAVDWWNKAILQGSSEACANLGIVYYHGYGVIQDCTLAVELWKNAAAKGNTRALFNLGTAYWEGKGVVKDNTKGQECFQQLADQGIAEAQSKLGYAYLLGECVVFDVIKGDWWTHKSKYEGYIGAQDTLGITYLYCDAVVRNRANVLKWYQKSANQGIADAQLQMARAFHKGWGGVDQDDAKALEWYRKAAAQGIAEAEYMVGNSYRLGHGIGQDNAEAVKWFHKAADQGHKDAEFRLGLAYWFDEYGVARNFVKALDYRMKAVIHGSKEAHWRLNQDWSFHTDAPLTKGSLPEVDTLRDQIKEMKSRFFSWFLEPQTLDSLRDENTVTERSQSSMAVTRVKEGECKLLEKHCNLIKLCNEVEEESEKICEVLNLIKKNIPGFMINIVTPKQKIMDVLSGQDKPKCLSCADEHINWGEENVILFERIKEIDETFDCIISNLSEIQEKFSLVLKSVEETKPNETQFISTFKTLIFDNIDSDLALLAEAKRAINTFSSEGLVGIRNQMFLDANPWFKTLHSCE